jgi:arylsulfatase A-like enzyme
MRYLADEGYVCGLAGKYHLSPADPMVDDDVPMTENRIDDGYAEFHWSHDSRPSLDGHVVSTNEYHHWLRERGIEYSRSPFQDSQYVETSMPEKHHHTTWCAEKAINFLEANASANRPWAFTLNFFDPHVPFDPPSEYLERYLPKLDTIPLPNYVEGERDEKPVFHRHPPSQDRFPFHEMDAKDHRLVRAAYWAMIDLIDDQIGRVLDNLERTGQRENTVVIFTSDHGEMLGDHGIYLKGPYFYESAIRVPLIIDGPGLRDGQTSDALVELVDLTPTIFDFVGVHKPNELHGRSLAPLLTGKETTHREDVYCEYYHALERPQFYDELQQDRSWGGASATTTFHVPFLESDVLSRYADRMNNDLTLPYGTMVRSEQYKLIRWHGLDEGELYDINEDPDETNNRYEDPSYQDVRAQMLARLSDRMAGTIDPHPQRRGRF